MRARAKIRIHLGSTSLYLNDYKSLKSILNILFHPKIEDYTLF